MWQDLADSLVPVDDTTAGEVVGGKLDDHSVSGQDADVMLAHLSADGGQNLVPVGQLNAKHCVGQRLDHGPLEFEGSFFLRHVLSIVDGNRFLGAVGNRNT